MSKINPADAHSDHKAFISQLDDTIENAPMGIFKASPDGNYVYFNRALARMYGFESAEKMVCSMADVDTLICSKPEKLDHFKKILETEGELTSHESLKVPGEQRDFWVSRNISAIKDDQGNILFYQGFILDVTEQKKIEQELNQKTEHLRKRIKMLNCINRISGSFHSSHHLEGALREAVDSIPMGFQYSEITALRIEYGQNIYQSDNYQETPWQISLEIVVDDQIVGQVVVVYLEEKPAADYGPFLLEEWNLLQNLCMYLSLIIRLHNAENEFYKEKKRLRERIKELGCINRISRAFNKDEKLEDMLKEALSIIPSGWQYPEITAARIEYEGQEFETENYLDTRWRLSQNIRVNGQVQGKVIVVYTEERPVADKGPFLDEECSLLRMIARHISLIINLGMAKKEFDQEKWRLSERIKELKCLNRISTAFHKEKSLDDVLNKAVAAIPPGWQHPEVTVARITYMDRVFQSENFVETPWKMSLDIIVNEHRLGEVTVCYLRKMPIADDGPFLMEEWDLLRMIAINIGGIIERKRVEDTLRNQRWRLGERIKELKCINRISQAFHKGTTLEEVLKKAVAAIPPGWQYPEITAARVTHGDQVFQTRNYKDTPWHMSQVIMVNGEVSGKITVAYLIEKPEADDGPFLNEEWDLLRMIARHLSVIIERVLSEQENQHQRWRLESIIEGANPGTWEWNVVTGEAVINDTWAEIIGYKQQELKPVTSRIWKKFAHPNDLAKSNDLLKKHFAGELPGYDCDLRIRHKQGHWVWVRNRGRVVTWDEKGRAVMMFGTTTDITDRKKAREKLLQTNRQLEAETLRANEMSTRAREADQAKSQFLANMSHEIRTPMNGIIGMSELLMETKMSQEQKKYADIIRSSANSLLYLINDILDFSKIEARKLALCTDNFDLNVILGEVEDMLEYRAREQGLDFSWHIDSSVNTLLQGDPGRLRQILVNLAGNAVKFTEHGEISIRVKELSRKEKKTKLHFEVRDTGSGISQSDQEALFDPFIQAGQSARKKYQGTGLGLAISKQLAEMMNGAIGVVSEPGKGSTFWFTAEFGEHSGKSTYKPTAASKDSENEMQIFKTRHSEARVLLVEDNITNQEVTRSILHKLGFKYVDSACNGLEALECLAARKYSLVLMDCQMPEMDGFEATRAIRKGDADVLNPEVPIIAMTAYAMKTDQEKCIQAGMNYYMSKPVHPHKLARMVDMALQSIDAGEIACADSRNEVQHSVPSDPAAPVVFNESELLDRVMNDYDLMKEILGHFLEEIPDRIKHLKQSLARGDVIEAGAFAHSIKGTSANVGAHRIYTISSAISKQSAREDVADLKIMTKELVEEFECFKKHIQKYFDV